MATVVLGLIQEQLHQPIQHHSTQKLWQGTEIGSKQGKPEQHAWVCVFWDLHGRAAWVDRWLLPFDIRSCKMREGHLHPFSCGTGSLNETLCRQCCDFFAGWVHSAIFQQETSCIQTDPMTSHALQADSMLPSRGSL